MRYKVLAVLKHVKGAAKGSFTNDIESETLQQDPDIRRTKAIRLLGCFDIVIDSLQEGFGSGDHVRFERVEVLYRKGG